MVVRVAFNRAAPPVKKYLGQIGYQTIRVTTKTLVNSFNRASFLLPSVCRFTQLLVDVKNLHLKLSIDQYKALQTKHSVPTLRPQSSWC